MLPNVAEPLLLTLMLTMGDALLALAGLSLIGVGVQPPSYDWGGMLTEGIQRIYVTPIVVVGPAVAIIFAALGFNLLGESLARRAARRDGTLPRNLPAPVVLPPEHHERVAEPADDGRETVLDIRGLTVAFPGGSVPVRDVSITIEPGEIVGIVGESGSGKTTLGLALLRLISSQGPIAFMGKSLQGLKFKQMRPFRRDMQIVFQDPYGSLSPRMSVCNVIEEGLWVHQPNLSAEERGRKVIRALTDVGLNPDTRFRYPHEFSGGQRQRIAVARAIVLEPTFIVLDEPTSALDMLIQAQIVDLLRDLQKRRELTFLFISHDLKVVSALACRLMVMRHGKVVEEGPASEVFKNPQDPYTRALFAAAFNLEIAPEGVVAQ
jgi:microcin C transport system ATP-binding protein